MAEAVQTDKKHLFDNRALRKMIVPLFLEQLLKEKDHTSALLGLGMSLLCLLVFGSESFVIPSMLAILGGLTLLRGPLEKKERAGELR